MGEVNLLDETLECLADAGKSSEDVLWVGVIGRERKWITDWDRFEAVARELDYDDGFGLVEIDSHLIVVGSDFWLERREYDGSEWWQVCSFPEKPNIFYSTITAQDLLQSE